MRLKFNFNLKIFACLQFVAISVLLLAAAAGYLIAHVTGRMNSFILRLVDVSAESSIPTYFSTLNLLLSAVLLFIVYCAEKKQNGRFTCYWLILALIFVYLSVDEGAQIHECFSNVGRYLATLIGIRISWLNYSRYWLLFGIPMTLIVGVVFIPFIRALPIRTGFFFVVAAALFISGAIGFELAGDWITRMGFSTVDPINQLRRLLEEGFEMFGIAIFNCALLAEIIHREVDIRLS